MDTHIILSAPSGAGKTTIAHKLRDLFDKHYAFSISACTRAKRPNEVRGKDYYFFSVKKFKEKLKDGEFIESEEVYKNTFYGTLKSEVERIEKEGKKIIFDVDVKGAQSLKDFFGSKAVSILIMPPSLEVLGERLRARKTDSPKKIKERLAKAKEELREHRLFDFVVINDNLDEAIVECIDAVQYNE